MAVFGGYVPYLLTGTSLLRIHATLHSPFPLVGILTNIGFRGEYLSIDALL